MVESIPASLSFEIVMIARLATEFLFWLRWNISLFSRFKRYSCLRLSKHGSFSLRSYDNHLFEDKIFDYFWWKQIME